MKVLLNSFHLNGRQTRVLSTDLEVRTTLYSLINSTTLKYMYYSIAFIGMVTRIGVLSTDLEVKTSLYSIINSREFKQITTVRLVLLRLP